MNNYITLDGKKYKTPGKVWNPTVNKPTTVRYTLLGAIDGTFGAANLCDWDGEIEGPVTPIDGTWGSIGDLRATLAKLSALSLIDHYGATYTVICQGPFREQSFMNMWDSPSNHIAVTVKITKVS
jgi:hypothetical protein